MSIHRTVAYDRDEGPNAEVTYTLKGSQNSQFYINSTTGEIFSRKDLSPGELFDVTVSHLRPGPVQALQGLFLSTPLRP